MSRLHSRVCSDTTIWHLWLHRRVATRRRRGERHQAQGRINARTGFVALTTHHWPSGHRYLKRQLETTAGRVGTGGRLYSRSRKTPLATLQPTRQQRFMKERMAGIAHLLLFAALFGASWAGGAKDSNAFMDLILLQKMPNLVRSNSRLFPNVTIPEFKFKVENTRGLNRDLKVKMKEGAVRGFDTGIRRTTDCNPPAPVAFNVSVSCILNFNGLYTTFVAKTEGDNLLGTEKRVPVNVTVVDTTGRFEATSATGRAGVVRTFHIDKIRLRTTYGDNLHLNDARKTEFLRQIEEKVTAVLYDALYNEYMHLLNRALDGLRFPNP
ncbi:salivary anticoagulant protein P23 [Rhipicephalus microplus]|uniref:salivary anticoagulant protein P23 n=1 Tax=Rhipicephalus microplus TaxID=6941 RepID=UPI003F6A9783